MRRAAPKVAPARLEDLADRLGFHSLHVAQALGDVEHRGCRQSFCASCEVSGSLVALLASPAPRSAARSPAARRRRRAASRRARPDRARHQTGGKAAGENVRRRVAPRRLAVTKVWVSSVGVGAPLRPRGNPALGLLQHGRAQQQPAWRARRQPNAAPASPYSVCLPDPGDVGRQRLAKPLERCRQSALRSSKKMKLRRAAPPAPPCRQPAGSTIGAKRLLSDAA